MSTQLLVGGVALAAAVIAVAGATGVTAVAATSETRQESIQQLNRATTRRMKNRQDFLDRRFSAQERIQRQVVRTALAPARIAEKSTAVALKQAGRSRTNRNRRRPHHF